MVDSFTESKSGLYGLYTVDNSYFCFLNFLILTQTITLAILVFKRNYPPCVWDCLRPHSHSISLSSYSHPVWGLPPTNSNAWNRTWVLSCPSFVALDYISIDLIYVQFTFEDIILYPDGNPETIWHLPDPYISLAHWLLIWNISSSLTSSKCDPCLFGPLFCPPAIQCLASLTNMSNLHSSRSFFIGTGTPWNFSLSRRFFFLASLPKIMDSPIP